MRTVLRPRSVPLLLTLLIALGCSGPGVPSVPQTAIQPTPVTAVAPPPQNTPPRIVGLTVSANRIEVGEVVTLEASVQDDETAADELTYEWVATAGSITGTGRIVKWTAPLTEPTPATYTISLIVIDAPGSGAQTIEQRVKAETSVIHVDNSPKAVRALSEEFIRDFANSSISPEACVRNFSDSCRGKWSELADVTANRRTYVIQSYKFSVSSVTINASRAQASVSGPCEFRSKNKETNTSEVAIGTCELTLVNENYRWWLCDSWMRGANAAGLRFPF